MSALSVVPSALAIKDALDIMRREILRLLPSAQWLHVGLHVGLHAGRTVFAALLALYLAYALELDSPASAAVTVMIVSHPIQGMVWSKGVYRGLGTLIGALMAIVLAALFAQTPVLFLLGFGLWMGLCAGLSTVLRNFRSYGAVLAGYTVGLIVFPNFPGAPDTLFALVASRVATVLLGMACSAVVGSLTTRRNSGRQLSERLRLTLARLAAYAQLALTPHALKGTEPQRHALRGEIVALDALMEFAAAEGTEVAGLIDSQRGCVMTMLSCLTATASAHDAATQILGTAAAGESDLSRWRDGVSAALDALAPALNAPEGPARVAALTAAVDDFARLRQRWEDALSATDFAAIRLFDRFDAVLDDLTVAAQSLIALNGGDAGHRVVVRRPVFHREWKWAAINGLRAALTVWLAGALWVVTAWPAGGMMIGAIVPNVGLLSLRDRPDKDALEFVKGISLAIGVGMLCLTLILPNLTGFPLLALTLAPLLFWGTLQSMRPDRAFIGLGFLVFFLTLLAPGNAMHYDLAAFLNNSMAVLSGAVLTALVHRVILRVHPQTHVRALLFDIRTDVRQLVETASVMDPILWETLMHDRMLRLGARLKSAGIEDVSLMHGAHAALRLGRDIIRLRQLLNQQGLSPQFRMTGKVVTRALTRHMASNPRRAIHMCRLAARRFIAMATQDPAASQTLGRAATSLVEIAVLLGRHRRFFCPDVYPPRVSPC